MDLAYFVNLFVGLIGVILFFTTYTYIDKLEKLGCPCAEHPHRSFIKNFCIWAIIYLIVLMVIPPKTLMNSLGNIGGVVLTIIGFVFVIMFIIFFIVSMRYTSYLMREKCKCSEDVRREALYYWSIIEIILYAILLVVPLFFMILGSAFAIVLMSVKYVHESAAVARDIALNPVSNIAKIPASVKASAKAASKLMRKRR